MSLIHRIRRPSSAAINMNRRPLHRYMRTNRHNQRATSLYATALIFQVFQSILQLDTKPPTTILLIAVNLLIYYLPLLRPLLPPVLHPLSTRVLRATDTRAACLQPSRVLAGHTRRLLVSSFVHVDDLHLAYNLSSFLYKGVTLESAMGTPHFLALVLYLSFTAHFLYILIALALRQLGFPSFMNNCLVGFSGVIFGLKTVLNANPTYARRAETIFGFTLPGGAPWVELLLASALSPNVSFLGHLTGILAGLLYIWGMRYFTDLARARARRRSQGRYAR